MKDVPGEEERRRRALTITKECLSEGSTVSSSNASKTFASLEPPAYKKALNAAMGKAIIVVKEHVDPIEKNCVKLGWCLARCFGRPLEVAQRKCWSALHLVGKVMSQFFPMPLEAS